MSTCEPIISLQQYVQKVYDIVVDWGMIQKTTHPWFRGHEEASDDWELKPALYRARENPEREREMVRDFMLRATAFLNYKPLSNMEWLFIMQHYGLPTRLLDWTESHLTALFFAVKNDDNTKDAAVWILEPWSLNFYIIGQRIPSSDDEVFEKYTINVNSKKVPREVEAEKPLAVRPTRSSERIIAQRGMFTIHGNNKDALDKYRREDGSPLIKLKKLIIDRNYKRLIKKQLYLAGVSHATIFPEMSELSAEIRYRYSKIYETVP